MARKRYGSRRRRRGRFTFLYKLLSVLIICAAIVAALTLFFKVETIEVMGESRYSEATILEAAGVSVGDNLYLLNKYTVSSNIYQKCPYVQDVRINRQPPDTLVIEVTECSAVAAIAQNGSYWLISSQGKIVEKKTSSDLPKVDGCVLVDPAVGSWVQMEEGSDQTELCALLAALEDAGVMDQMEGIHLDDAGTVVMDYAGRFTVELPRGADYAKKLYQLSSAISQLETNETGTFNMNDEEKTFFIPGK